MIRIATTFALIVCLTACTKENTNSIDKAESASKVTASQTGAAKAAEAEMLTLDDLLAKHFEALGGEKKLLAAQTLYYAGTQTHGDKTVHVSKYIKRGKKLRVEKRMGDETSVMAFNGKQAWKQKGESTEELPAKKVAYLEHKADIDDPLLVYKKKGYTVSLVGKVEIKGNPAYHVSLQVGDSKEERFIDAKSYFEVKRLVTWKADDGAEHTTKVLFSDYRDIGEGMMVNHRVDWEGKEGKGTFIIEKAAYNKPMDDSKFDLGKTIL